MEQLSAQPRTAPDRPEDDGTSGCGRFAWIAACAGIPTVMVLIGLAGVAFARGNATGGAASLRTAASIFVPIVLFALLALALVCLDVRLYQAAFRPCSRTRKADTRAAGLHTSVVNPAGAGQLSSPTGLSPGGERRAIDACWPAAPLWIARVLTFIVCFLTLIGNAGSLTRSSGTSSPVSELAGYEFAGRSAVGVLITLGWLWIVGEVLWHLAQLCLWTYARLCKRPPAAAPPDTTAAAPSLRAGGAGSGQQLLSPLPAAASPPLFVPAFVPAPPLHMLPSTAAPASADGGARGEAADGVELSPVPAAGNSDGGVPAPVQLKLAPGSGVVADGVTVTVAPGLAALTGGSQPSAPAPPPGIAVAGMGGRSGSAAGVSAVGGSMAKARRAARWACPGRMCNWVPCPCRCNACAFCCAAPLPLWFAALLLVLAFVLSVVGLAMGLAIPAARTVPVTLARLPPQLAGLRVGIISDTHVGSATGLSRLQAAVDNLLAAKPQVVLLTGDIMDQDEGVFFPAWEAPMRQLAAACNVSAPGAQAAAAAILAGGPGAAARSPATDACNGVFFVTGNHEPDAGSVQGKVDMLISYGIRVLTNELVPIPYGAPPGHPASMDLIGVPDYATSGRAATSSMPATTYTTPTRFANESGADFALAVAGRNTSRELLVAAHQPRHAPDAASVGAGLMVSGHTHGGQLVPVVFLSGAANLGLVAGLYTYTRTATGGGAPAPLQVYVSRGTFQYSLPFRHIANEVTIIVLQAP